MPADGPAPALRGTKTGASATRACSDGVERGWNEIVASEAFELESTFESEVPVSFRAGGAPSTGPGAARASVPIVAAEVRRGAAGSFRCT